jgi:dipeptidyl-peptidase-3
VSLGNVLSASAPSEKITFLSPEDEAVFRAWRGRSFEVQVFTVFTLPTPLITSPHR